MPSPPKTENLAPGAPFASVFGGLNPDDLFARGIQSLRMTGRRSLENREPPTITEAARLFVSNEITGFSLRVRSTAVLPALAVHSGAGAKADPLHL